MKCHHEDRDQNCKFWLSPRCEIPRGFLFTILEVSKKKKNCNLKKLERRKIEIKKCAVIC